MTGENISRDYTEKITENLWKEIFNPEKYKFWYDTVKRLSKEARNNPAAKQYLEKKLDAALIRGSVTEHTAKIYRTFYLDGNARKPVKQMKDLFFMDEHTIYRHIYKVFDALAVIIGGALNADW